MTNLTTIRNTALILGAGVCLSVSAFVFFGRFEARAVSAQPSATAAIARCADDEADLSAAQRASYNARTDDEDASAQGAMLDAIDAWYADSCFMY